MITIIGKLIKYIFFGFIFIIPFLLIKVTYELTNSKVLVVLIGFFLASIFLNIRLYTKQTYVMSYFLTVLTVFLFSFIPGIIKKGFNFIGIDNNISVNIVVLLIVLTSVVFNILYFYKRNKTLFTKAKKIIPGDYNIEESFFFNNKSLVIANPYRGIYVQGGAGSGKSESIIKPIIKQSIEKSYAGIIYDFKSPELLEFLFSHIKESNTSIKAYVLDFKNPYTSDRCNLIDPNLMIKSAFALEYSEAVLSNLLPETIKNKDFFTRSSKSILAGVMWWLKKENPDYCTLPHAISLILFTDTEKLLNKMSSNNEVMGMIVSLKQAIERGAEKQVAAVVSTLQDSLSQLLTPEIFWLLSGNDFSLDINNKDNPIFLGIGNDSTLSNTYAPVISLAITVSSRLMNQPGKHKSIIVLDEAPSLFIPNFEKIPATARSNKIISLLGVQDFSQLIDKYGQEKASVLMSNLGNQFFGRTTNPNTAKNISDIFSKTDKTYKTKSIGSGTSGEFIHFNSNKNQGQNESIQERDRVKVNDIINLEVGHFYGIISEGNQKEIMNKHFQYESGNHNYYFKTNTSEKLIKQNFEIIIEESKNLVR